MFININNSIVSIDEVKPKDCSGRDGYEYKGAKEIKLGAG